MFGRRASSRENARREVHSSLVEMMLEGDEISRKRLMSLALKTGEIRADEAAEVEGIVRGLESMSLLGRSRDRTSPVAGDGVPGGAAIHS